MVIGFGLDWDMKFIILEVFIVDDFKIRVILLKLGKIGFFLM